MKKLILTLTLLLSAYTSATIVDGVTLNSLNSYHRANPGLSTKYKIANSSIYMFTIAAETRCSGGELVGWRTKQYDEDFKSCVNQLYRSAIKKAGFSTDIEEESLYSENIKLAEFLKNSVLKQKNVKVKRNEYGHTSVDIKDPSVTIEQLRDVQDSLELLIDSI